jgi:ribosomal protein S18 acetylase RimI-like enzyme
MILEHGGCVGMTPGYEAVGVFSPPGEPELTGSEQADFTDALLAACGEGGERAVTVMAALDAAHPADLPPHYHAMFAAVRPDARALGHGTQVARALAVVADAAGAGVYAEASNLMSLALWERLGVRRMGPEIALPDGGPILYPIWAAQGTWCR